MKKSLNDLSLLKLTMLYNSRKPADKMPVKKFASKGEAIKRLQAIGVKTPDGAADEKSPTKAERSDRVRQGLPSGKDTIGACIVTMLKGKKSPDEILKQVKKQFPHARTTVNSVAFYRSKLSRAGMLPKA